MGKMIVLCEESQAITIAFRKKALKPILATSKKQVAAARNGI